MARLRSISSSSTGAGRVAAMWALMMTVCSLLASTQAAVVCENHGSGDPTLSDAQTKADWLISYAPGTQCCQITNGGNYCTVLLSACSSRPCTGIYYEVRICGPYNQCMPCADAGGLTWEIINLCQRNDNGVVRVSGYNNGYSPFTIVLRNALN